MHRHLTRGFVWRMVKGVLHLPQHTTTVLAAHAAAAQSALAVLVRHLPLVALHCLCCICATLARGSWCQTTTETDKGLNGLPMMIRRIV
jgi:hypothetical protein